MKYSIHFLILNYLINKIFVLYLADSSENLAGMSLVDRPNSLYASETTDVKNSESGSRAYESNKSSDLMPLSILRGSYSAVVKSGSLKTISTNLTECKQTNAMGFRSNSTTRNSQEANTKKNRSLSRSGSKRSDSLGQPQIAPKRAVKPSSCEESSGLQKISVLSERNTNNMVREKFVRTPSGGRNIETSSPQKFMHSSTKLLSKPQPGRSEMPRQCVNQDPVQFEPCVTADNESNKKRRKKKSANDVASPQFESEMEFPGLPQADPELSTSTSLFRYSDVLKRQVVSILPPIT